MLISAKSILALLKIATGMFSYDKAVNDCAHMRLVNSGLRSVNYESGRTYQRAYCGAYVS